MFIRTRNNILYNLDKCSEITKAHLGNLFEIWIYIDKDQHEVFSTTDREERDEAYKVLCEGIAKGATMVDYYRGEVDDKNWFMGRR